MKEASNNFEIINGNNADRIGRVLAFTRSKEAIEIGRDLYSSANDWRRLAGAYVLVTNDVYPEEVDERSYLVRTMRRGTVGDDWDPQPSSLATEILGYLDDEVILTVFVDTARWGNTRFGVCDRLTESDSPEAVPGLRACLEDCIFLCGEVAARLVELEGNDAVGKVIERLQESESDSYGWGGTELKSLLEELAGERVGDTYEEWNEWWSASKNNWSVPESFGADQFLSDHEKHEIEELLSFRSVFRLLLSLSIPLGLMLIPIFVGISKSLDVEVVEGESKYAGFWPRLSALIIDGFLLTVPFLVACVLAIGRPAIFLVSVFVVGALVSVFYNVFFHAKYGATVGKMINRIEVRGVDGQPMDFRRAFYRHAVDTVFVLVGILATLLVVVPIRDSLWTTEVSLSFIGWFTDTRAGWGAFSDTAALMWMSSEIIVLLFNKKKRAFHDFIAGTVVVHRPRRKPE